MDTRDILKATESTKRLVQDEQYYKNIFKKTERIVSVVFYVSNSLEASKKTDALLSDILETAQKTHNAILHTLEVRTHVAEEAIRDSAQTLIALESKLRVAEVAGLVASEVMQVLSNEIDLVLRGMNKYLGATTAFDDMDYRVAAPSVKTENVAPRPAPRRPQSVSDSGGELDRRERIKTVLEAKGEATIKDVADVITDCSTKTIQRELNAMIEDNIVQRHGERRWSKYSVV